MNEVTGTAPTRTVHHGNTPAAWTTVVLVTLAFTVGTLAVMLANWIMFAGGVVLLVVAGIVGKAMQMLGLGAVPRR
ncbi:MAG: hypothetical protein F2793_01040 [Actinobacteria bacterium]|uniref:Unannotated protein n=1 Tax=freshwater metagenome TaxID=449393 RepID=A0A6J7CTF6_9ZZZZ|nr:hypothetical protein [Actinomycetota bacterium]